ncbi:hypothetical protein M9458_057548, partial [Cirrhinus mrigala]
RADHTMDSASTPTVQELLSVNNARMDQQEEHLLNTGHAVQALVAQVSELTLQLQQLRSPAAPPTPPSPPPLTNTEHLPEPRLPTPELYAGEPKLCRAFLTKCSKFFSLKPRTFATESSKVALVLTLLSGRAALWGTAVWENQHPCCSSFLALSEEMKRVFDRAVETDRYRTIRSSFARWRQSAAGTSRRSGTSSCMGWLIVFKGKYSLWIYPLIWMDSLIWHTELTPGYSDVISFARTPWHLISLPVQYLPPRIRSAPCSTKNPCRNSPTVDSRLLSGGVLLEKSSSTTLLPVRLQWAAAFHNCLALVDSGAEGNFMDFDFAHRLHIPVVPLTHKITVNALNGQALPDITHTTGPVTLVTSSNHLESITLLLTPSPLAPIVLGHPWLVQHNPRVDWGHNSVSAWSDSCYASWLVSACSSVSCSLLQNESVNLSNVPKEYRDLKEVFSKSRAASLPPHHPYDCAIDLVPAFERLQGASVFTKLDLRNAYHLVRIRKGDEWKTAFNTPRGHFEYQVMPFGLSNSPAVFQALVNDVLRDMVDQFIYVYLDDILIFSSSLQEHVQHVRRVLQRLLENGLFVKAEKCVFHAQSVPFLGYIISSEGVRMDPDKVKAVVDWPTPESRKALQRFLGFANFYRRFIRNFGQLATPLTALTSARTTFRWSSAAEAAFTKLKSRFVSAPILVAPDPTRQFVVEVDASEVGVGAVLSQRSASDDRMHPCAFFSRRLSPAERNYDIGNRELLAVKLALEEWRHWLEGSGVPFIVWTDHKNLEYIRSAKRLNSRQARWALFFGRFDFSISYRPGSKNIKPDALSRIFDHSEQPPSPESIIPGRLVVSTLSWEIESKVRTALEGVTPPPGCPPGRFIRAGGSTVIRWGSFGVNRTSFLVKQRFWWRSMARDIRDFVLACSACARGKTSNRPPEGLLQPLSVPSRPWSDIALDFITALPLSQGNTVVLTVVDRFSKAAHFIPLPKLPSAKETAVTVVDHVFRIHGLPNDVVSDRGPQFISRFWKEFCRLLGATVSLSSGFHPQSNGQTERANQDLERVLRCLVTQNPSSWSQQLPWVEYAHNSLPVSSTGLSPFECSLGYQPPIFPSLEAEVAVPSAHAFVQRCRRTWRRARETLLRVRARTKAQADRHRSKPPVYVVGQKVWLSSKDIPLRSVSNKLAPKFIGPFTVTKIISPVAVRLKLPPAYRRIHSVC